MTSNPCGVNGLPLITEFVFTRHYHSDGLPRSDLNTALPRLLVTRQIRRLTAPVIFRQNRKNAKLQVGGDEKGLQDGCSVVL